MFTNRILIRKFWYGVVCLTCFMGLTTVRMAEASNQVSLTGLWSFNFSLVVDYDDKSAGSEQIVTNVWLYEVGNTVFGAMGAAEHIVGSLDGINLSLDILSFGSSDRDVKKGGIQQVSKMTLKLVGGNLIGEGVILSPEAGLQAFEVYRVTAKRVTGDSSAALNGLPDWICDVLTAVLQKVFTKVTSELFAPMEVCYPNMNGGGYYLFGDTGPGLVGSTVPSPFMYRLSLRVARTVCTLLQFIQRNHTFPLTHSWAYLQMPLSWRPCSASHFLILWEGCAVFTILMATLQ